MKGHSGRKGPAAARVPGVRANGHRPYRQAFRRARAAVRWWAGEGTAPCPEEPVAALLALPADRRRRRGVTDRRLHTPAALIHLQEEVHVGAEAGDPEAEELARLGLLLAECLDPRRHPHGLVNDLRAAFWRTVARARLAAGDHRAALDPLATAEALVAVGSGDPASAALIDGEYAVFHLLAGDLRAAAAHLRRGADRYAAAGEAEPAVMALLAVAELLALEEERDEALAVARRARDLLAGDGTPLDRQAEELIDTLSRPKDAEPVH